MTFYHLTSSIRSPGRSTTFLEFSPDSRFLAIGDRDLSSLFILDGRTGYYLSAATLAKPTALVWDTTETFYVGLSNGCFVHYQIDLETHKFVKGAMNKTLCGVFPVTAIALNEVSTVLALSVGPDVFIFHRIHTADFRFIANISRRFAFRRVPGSPSPPFPKSICFIADNTLVVAFCHQYTASITLESSGESALSASLQSAEIDYSGSSILEAITSGDGLGSHQFARFWVYGGTFATDEESFPFLFVNGGMAILSGSTAGIAVIRNTITQREIQLLEHTAVDRCVRVMAHHVSNNKYTIATVDHGEGATIKVWSAWRYSSHSRISACRGFLPWKAWIIGALIVVIISTSLSQIEGLLDIKLSQYCFRIALAFIKLCIEIAHLAFDAAVLEGGEP